MTIFAYAVAFLAAGMSGLLFFRIRSLTSIVLWIPKALAGSAAAFLAVMGALGATLGVLLRAPLAIVSSVLCVEFPQTEHGFDLLLPRYAPAAQAALYEVDRFLALMV